MQQGRYQYIDRPVSRFQVDRFVEGWTLQLRQSLVLYMRIGTSQF